MPSSSSRRSIVVLAAAQQQAQSLVKTSPRGVIILPGLGNNSADYTTLAAKLEAEGLVVTVAQVSRIDWSRNAAALGEKSWWEGRLNPRPAVDWYLTKVDTAMQELKQKVDGGPITMLTHSAGGWLGRVYLHGFGTAGVDRFVSLGSPHQPPPAGIMDQTRGILTHCSENFPGAFHPEINYTTIAGKFVKGAKLDQEGSPLAKFAGAGYQQVCGDAEVWGDFIVPQACAHLEGATQLDLPGVFHSPLGEKLPFFGPWYGSDSILPLWLPHLTGVGIVPEQTASAVVVDKQVVLVKGGEVILS
ncbi:MAG: hypothetical protein WDW36_009386 [Sanguina aurantia]